ncbi:MAG: hypothetical protein DIZ78_16650 [endosymbiont of Escarpia spicata]|uniref:Uncharacterized protein n=1 Tax=endosymbiont of Escarpia spicata TaxID=2200908 RepID=A0A370DCN9_9GAMM|nr:MAG: hypothetical protein DIZ78_16650 [endosymbiont of Escarpia spicata]
MSIQKQVIFIAGMKRSGIQEDKWLIHSLFPDQILVHKIGHKIGHKMVHFNLKIEIKLLITRGYR